MQTLNRCGVYRCRRWLGAMMLFLGVAFVMQGQDYQIVDRGAHHRRWERTFIEILADGSTVEYKSSYVELSTGMHYWRDGWQTSKAEFKILPGGAVAEEGLFKLIVSPDIANEGAVDLFTPDGRRLLSSPRWLSYYNPATRQSVMIAAVKSCAGVLMEPNVIVFPDAFDDLHAALRYTWRASGVEQDVVLLESGPLRPQDWGLNNNAGSVVLEMWSEMHQWPQPLKLTESVENGLPDVRLDFGDAQIGIGKAFSLDDEEDAVSVGKSWVSVEGRQFLVEAVRQSDLEPLLAQIPQQARVNNAAPVRQMAKAKPVAGRSALLANADERLRSRERKLQTAAFRPATERLGRGVVLDYSVVTAASNFRFAGNSTYLITNSVNLTGTTTIEGGAILKFVNTTNPGSNRLLISGPIDCQTSSAHPAIFTSKDDDSVGEVIIGSTGSPGTNRYAGRALDLSASSTTFDLHDLRFRHVDKAIYVNSSSANLNLSHTQIGYANYGIQNAHPNGVGRNLLIYDSLYAVGSANGGTNRLEHATIHRVTNLRSGGTLFLTNSLLICVTNNVAFTGSNVETNLSEAGIFQTVGSGSRYLSSQSAYRNAGTTNINPDLLSEIRKRTTYPPIILSNDIVVDLVLSPQAQRDTDLPDLGFHFESLDYCFSGVTLTNATLVLTNGVAIGVFGTNGILLHNGARLVSEGSALRRNRIVRYSSVQEGSDIWGPTAGTMSLFRVKHTTSSVPEARFRFTDISLLADTFAESHVIGDLFTYILGALEFKDSTLRGGYFDVRTTYASPPLHEVIGITNSLLYRGTYYFNAAYYGDSTPVTMHLRNNLVKDCTLNLNNMTNTTSWTAHDTLFDTVTLSGPQTVDGVLVNSHNGYMATTVLVGDSNSQSLTNVDYQVGPLGSYYYPTNGGNLSKLLGAGSRNADAAGLYHFTVTTNQVIEGSSTVDIGMHFVASDSMASSASPLDGDGDGWANYFEDRDGDGVADAGERGWLTYDSLHGATNGPGLVVFTLLK